MILCSYNNKLTTVKKRGRGRPPIPPEERKDRVVRLRMTEEDVELLDEGATRAGLSWSEYIRELIRGTWRTRRKHK